jgi:transketolase
LVAQAAAHQGIVYIRTSRPPTPTIYTNAEEFPIGGSKVLRSSDSDRVTVIAAGVTLHEALKAYETLKADGISIRVIDLYSVKPVDAKTVLDAAAATNNTIVTVEDHYPEGGLNDAVMDAVAPRGVTVHKLAVNGLPRSGKADELLEAHGISAGAIVRKVREII